MKNWAFKDVKKSQLISLHLLIWIISNEPKHDRSNGIHLHNKNRLKKSKLYKKIP
jgi:hypothetical protein